MQSLTADGNLTWGQKSTAEGVTPSLENDLMHMRYDKTAQGTKTVLRYVEDGGGRNGKLATIFADTGINRMALYQDDDATNGTDLGTLQLNHLFTTATGVQYADRRVARLQVTKTVTADSGLTAPTKDANGNDLTFYVLSSPCRIPRRAMRHAYSMRMASPWATPLRSRTATPIPSRQARRFAYTTLRRATAIA